MLIKRDNYNDFAKDFNNLKKFLCIEKEYIAFRNPDLLRV